MKVLWLVASAIAYKPDGEVKKRGYNGGGWITSAQKLLMANTDIMLGVCFQMKGQPRKCVQEGVTYYPIEPLKGTIRSNPWYIVSNSRLYRQEEKHWEYYYGEFRRVIEDFRPDIIHVFGSEFVNGLIVKVTEIPVLLHLQGIVNPIFDAFLPPAMSWRKYILSVSGLKAIVERWLSRKAWNISTYREREILSSVKYYMGRTAWDERVTKVLNPEAKYFFCNEVLRDEFYEGIPRQLPERLTIVTTISEPPYKGFDLVLKTAKLLKENLIKDFDWRVYGVTDYEYMEKFCHILHEDVNIKMMGVATADELKRAELNATVYVHSSYIENSPNSLCEAQLLGVTCIATNVGGVPSLIQDGETGYLVPANDPYQIAYLIHQIYRNPELNIKMGLAAQQVARVRHDRKEIGKRIVEIYKEILEQL